MRVKVAEDMEWWGKAAYIGMMAPRLELGSRFLAAIMLTGMFVCLLPPLAGAAGSEFALKNLRVGLVCGPEGHERVCFERKDIDLTNEGRCIANGNVVACTWFGYSFDYAALNGDVVLRCVLETDKPHDNVNPNGILARNTTHVPYELRLKQNETHFFNPQYASAGGGDAGSSETQTQTCSYDGKAVFEFTLTFHYPQN